MKKKIFLIFVLISFLFISTSCGLFNKLFYPYLGEWENSGTGSDGKLYLIKLITSNDFFEYYTYKDGLLIHAIKARVKFTASGKDTWLFNGNEEQKYENGSWQASSNSFIGKLYFTGEDKNKIYIEVIINAAYQNVVSNGSMNAFNYLKRK
ncbi:MAG: hypothetical protein N3A58_01675 [Spirochaetes bacterium]|nr:hypothetical protein [Spirochaetota bacterium]